MNNEEKERYRNLLIYQAEQEFLKNMWRPKMEVKLLSCTGDIEHIIEYGGRTCYDSHDKMNKNSTLLDSWKKSGHMSVFEHSSATFEIKGVSRALMAQMTRHRSLSFSVRSQRYVNEDNFGYITPDSISDKGVEKLYREIMERTKEDYKTLIQLGVRKEDARYILPNACTTEFVVTGNMRAWLHFLELRESKGAQWEIRELAETIRMILKEKAPNIF